MTSRNQITADAINGLVAALKVFVPAIVDGGLGVNEALEAAGSPWRVELVTPPPQSDES